MRRKIDYLWSKGTYVIVLFVCTALLSGCADEEFPMPGDASDIVTKRGDGGGTGVGQGTGDLYSDGMMVLGDTIPDFNTVAAMRVASLSLFGNYGPMPVSSINTTHYYVRYKPADEEEYAAIERFELTDFPLHVESSGGSHYHDPSIPEDEYTWQYAIVKKDSLNTAVQHEILKELYIIEEPAGAPGVTDGAGGPSGPGGPVGPSEYDTYKQLEDHAIMLANLNKPGAYPGAGPNGTMSEWKPSGTIMMYDETLGRAIPVEGVTVVIYRGTKKCETKTDAAGKFKADFKLKYQTYYAIKWRMEGNFKIKESKDILFGLIATHPQAWLKNGKTFATAWEPVISPANYSHRQAHYASIYRAGYRSYSETKDYLGMTRPSKGIKIAYYNYYNQEDAPAFYNGFKDITGLGPAIRVRGKDSQGNQCASLYIFNSILHELGHANHHRVAGSYTFGTCSGFISESWADAVAYLVMKKEYEEFGGDFDTYVYNYIVPLDPFNPPPLVRGPIGNGYFNKFFVVPSEYNGQMWPYKTATSTELDDQRIYSPFFIDLVDDNNQCQYYWVEANDRFHNYPNDNVSGYRMDSLQKVVGRRTGWVNLKSDIRGLRSAFPQNTLVMIDSLIARYEKF